MPMRETPIPLARKRELMALASAIVDDVLAKVPESRERCFLNAAVHMQLDR